MKTNELNISSLRKKIIEKIQEKEKMVFGWAGTERTSIKMKLSDIELVEFSTLKFDEHYSFKIDKNCLTATYANEI